MGHLVQMAGLAVQNFVSAAVGMAVAVALVRGLRPPQHRRARQLLGRPGPRHAPDPAADLVVGAIVLVAGGAIQNFHLHDQVVNTLAGGQQTITGGPVASQEAIKELGTNGGGFYNANSAHPFENPNAWTNWFEIFLLLVIPFSLPRTFGRMVGEQAAGLRDRSRSWASLGARSASALIDVVPAAAPRHRAAPRSARRWRARSTRFGVADSAVFAAVDHADVDRRGGLVPRLLHQPRRHDHDVQHACSARSRPAASAPACTACSILAIITVFVAGLMVGRTPEYLGKKITAARDQARRAVLPDHAR